MKRDLVPVLEQKGELIAETEACRTVVRYIQGLP